MAKEHIKYLTPLVRQQLPPIFEFNHLAELLGRTPEYLTTVFHATKKHYREFFIPKRSGKKRRISAPYPALLECQRWILENILEKLTTHSSVHGFKAKMSIISNANAHLNTKHLLKLDIKDFFPSISERRVIALFRSLGYSKDVSFYLGRICCLNGKLPQGSACSPYLSNLVAYRLDCRLQGLSQFHSLTYTRYADDLTFSGEKIPLSFIPLSRKIIREEGLNLNEDKIRLFRSQKKKIVTGLDVSGETLKVPRNFRRKVIQEIYYCSKFGFESHVAKKKISNPFYMERLKGQLAFWESVEPDSLQLKIAKEQLASCSPNSGPI